MQLSLDRKAFVDILSEGINDIGAVLQPPPEGIWGMPPEILQSLPGYGPDVAKNREEARALMRLVGYRPDNRLKVKVSTAISPGIAIRLRSSSISSRKSGSTVGSK